MNNGQEKRDTEKTKSISIRHVLFNPFGNNISAEKSYKRSERIVAALYVLTKNVPDDEPIKCLTRETGHLLLKDIISLRSGFRVSGNAPAIVCIHTRVRELISASQLLAVSGFVSKENADLVTRALEELTQFIESSRGTEFAEETVLVREDLLMDGRISNRRESTTPVLQGMPRTTKNLGNVGGGVPSVWKKGEGTTSGRRGAILDVLKDGRQMGIKDIASFVVGCSEKTVQRELAALISEGLLKKEGEKRWSKYFLVSNT